MGKDFDFRVGADCKHGRRPELCWECHPELAKQLAEQKEESIKKQLAEIGVKSAKAVVKEIQVGGYHTCHSLRDACEEYLDPACTRSKMLFAIELPSGEVKQITIRDEDGEVVAYGDFDGLPDFLEYSVGVWRDE